VRKFQYGGAIDDVTATGKKMNHTSVWVLFAAKIYCKMQ